MPNFLKKGVLWPLSVMGSTTHSLKANSTHMNRFYRKSLARGLACSVLCAWAVLPRLAEARFTPGSSRDRGTNASVKMKSDRAPLLDKWNWSWRPRMPKLPSLKLGLFGSGKRNEGTVDVVAEMEKGDDFDASSQEIVDEESLASEEADEGEPSVSAIVEEEKGGEKRPRLGRKLGNVINKNVIGPFKNKEKPSFAYLPKSGPAPLRFSDEGRLSDREPSPALPEFSLMSIEHGLYLTESPLPEEEKMDNSVYADVVIEMAPTLIVSGEIDYDKGESSQKMAEISVEEDRPSVVRAEDVLIFFESSSPTGNAQAVIPFSPAVSNQSPPAESSATYKIKE